MKKFWMLMVAVFTGVAMHAQMQTDTISYLENGERKVYEIIYLERDTVTGNEIAVYASDTTQMAFKNYRKNGKLYGPYIHWYPNGNYRTVTLYGYGKKHGDFTAYNKAGEIITKGKYRDGVAHGFWNHRDEGCMGRYKKGKRNGIWKCTLADGTKKRMIYVDGELRQ